MINNEELKKFLLVNRVNENGDLILSGLDFSDFDGDVFISEMKVKKDLCQNCQEVGGNLFQDSQEVGGNLLQYYQTVGGNLFQDSQEVGGNLWQNYQTVGEDLWQNCQTVGKDLLQDPRIEDIKSVKEWLSLLKKSGVNSKQQVIKQMEMWLKKEE